MARDTRTTVNGDYQLLDGISSRTTG